jgi:hypothetical protein
MSCVHGLAVRVFVCGRDVCVFVYVCVREGVCDEESVLQVIFIDSLR